MDAPNGREMLCQMVEQLLLSAGLWIKTRGQVSWLCVIVRWHFFRKTGMLSCYILQTSLPILTCTLKNGDFTQSKLSSLCAQVLPNLSVIRTIVHTEILWEACRAKPITSFGVIWVPRSLQVQTYLYSHLVTELSNRTLGNTGLVLHELVGVHQLLFILKEHYSLVGEPREDEESRSKVRAYLLLIVKEFVSKVTLMWDCEVSFIHLL